jgi:four helix bundle protein
MLEEARSAERRRDFISKCAIGLKEARESLVRLRICLASQSEDQAELLSLVREADEMVAVLMAIVRNARRNLAESARRSTSGTNS